MSLLVVNLNFLLEVKHFLLILIVVSEEGMMIGMEMVYVSINGWLDVFWTFQNKVRITFKKQFIDIGINI